MGVRIIAVYTKRDEISKIIEQIKDYSFEEFIESNHFKFSILEKATDLELLKKTFPKFELIKSIELRENDRGIKYYGFNYELQDGTFVIIALILDKQPPTIINGYHKNVNYKRFEKSLRKNYGNKFI